MADYSERQLDQMLDDYQRRRSFLTDVHTRMKSLTGTATSPRREVSVTVQHTGAVVDITFSGTAYKRLPPRELTDLILKTMAAAIEKAVEQAAEVMSPIMPAGMDAKQLLAGKVGMETFLPSSGPRMADAVREQLDRP